MPNAWRWRQRALTGGASLLALTVAVALATPASAAKVRYQPEAKQVDRATKEKEAKEPFGPLPKGPLQIFVSINQQKLHLYADGTQDHLNDEQQRFADSGNHVVKDGSLSLVAKALGGGKYASGMIRSRETFYYGGASIFSFTPTDEPTAMKVNRPYTSPKRYIAPPDDGVEEDEPF